MNFSRILTLPLCALALAACTSQNPQTTAPAANAAAPAAEVVSADAPAEADANRVVCKTVIPTGSRIGTRSCMSVSAWEQQAKDGRDAVERVQRNSMTTGVKSS